MKCDNCGREASGKFCSNCGGSLGTNTCPSCGHNSPAGARFCNQCGGAISTAGSAPPKASAPPSSGRPSPAANGRNNSLWVVGGVVLAGATLVALYPIFSPQSKNIVPPPPAAAQGSATNIDLATMTPRQAADRLWNRVMRAVAEGNTQEVTNFLPMAIAAFEMAEPLDLDGKYHLSALKLEGSDNQGALETAIEGLELYPDHLLNLAAAAEASLALGDSAAARSYYQKMMDVWGTEIATQREEYQAHEKLQPVLLQSAEALLGG